MRPVFQPPFFRCETSFSRLERESEREEKERRVASLDGEVFRKLSFQTCSDVKKKIEEVNKANKCSQTLIVPLSASRRAASRHPHNLPLSSSPPSFISRKHTKVPLLLLMLTVAGMKLGSEAL